MIDLYTRTTPNGYKPMLFVEEAGVAANVVPVDIGRGEQFSHRFLEISPNNRIPAIVDHEPDAGGKPISIFESGAILVYLAEKTGMFLPADPRARTEVLQWLFWQMGGLGPMLGQNLHFSAYASERVPYAIERYERESARLYGVLDRRLAEREFIAGDYSIADMASYPWLLTLACAGETFADFPSLARWMAAVAARPATGRAYARGQAIKTAPTVTSESKKIRLGRGATHLAA